MSQTPISSGPREGRYVLAAAAVLGGLAVMAGAFGAHGLEGRVEDSRLVAFETAARYHMYHALALGLIALLMMRGMAGLRAAAGAMLIGVALFSGSLYVLVLADAPALGYVTPFGGVALIIGWGLLALAAFRGTRTR